MPDDLAGGPEVEVVFGAGLSHADLAGQNAAADLGPEFHLGEHSCLPSSEPKAALSLTGGLSGALHFLVGTALHFLIGKHTASPRKVSSLRTTCTSTSAVISSASVSLPSIRKARL